MLEMSAEATRNPLVANMLIEAEARMFANACEHLKKQFPHLSDEHIRCCVEITAVMIEGTIYRRLTPLKSTVRTIRAHIPEYFKYAFLCEVIACE